MGRATGARRKRLSYSDRLGRTQEEHQAHWQGFTWEAGPWSVMAIGIWGTCQCLAASEAEGKRVIRHALTFGGYDPDDPAQGEWTLKRFTGRLGQPGTYETATDRYGLQVTKRAGSNGAPFQ